MRQVLMVTMLAVVASLSTSTMARAEISQIIARLAMRNHVVYISQGSNGQVVYSVKSQDGKLLDANLNEQQFQAKYPEIHQGIRPAIADTKENSEQMLMLSW